MPGIGVAAGTWKERALRAEAERDARPRHRLDQGDGAPGPRARGRARARRDAHEPLVAADRAAAPARRRHHGNESDREQRQRGSCGRDRLRLRDHRPRRVPRVRRARHRGGRRARREGLRLRGGRQRLPRPTTSCSTPRPTATTSRRWCSSTARRARTTPTCARRCAPPSPTPTWPSSGCMGAAGVRTLAWWEGQVSAGDVSVQYNQFGGGRLPALSFTSPAVAARRGRHGRRAPDGALALGRAPPALRRGAAASGTATTSTTACPAREAGRKVLTARSRRCTTRTRSS